MSTNYPGALDTFTNPLTTDGLATVSHAAQHDNINDSVAAIQAKLGINGSAVTSSFDYKLSEVLTSASDKAVGKTATQTLTNKTLTAPKINVGGDATGDTYYRDSGGLLARLAAGADGSIVSYLGGIPVTIPNPAASDASTTVKGVVEKATTAEITAGTSTGATGAQLFIGADAVGSAGAYKLVQYDSAGKYPAADGSAITNITGANINGINIRTQVIHIPNTETTIASTYVTTDSTGVSTTNPIFAASGGSSGGNAATVSRFIKLSNGSVVLTHKVDITGLGVADTNVFGIAVVGSFVYVVTNNGGSPLLLRFSTTDLTGGTVMTVSGTALTVATGLFSDGTNLYNTYTAGAAKKYTISGTTATSSTDTSFTSITTTAGYWSDGTSVYAITPGATYKWALSGGARTTGTVLYSEQYLLSGTIQTDGGGIFKEANNTSQILTIQVNKTTNPIGTIIPVTTF